MNKQKNKTKFSKAERAAVIALVSLVITLALWAIPWVSYAPGTTGRGFPIVWYTKWVLGDSVAQIYPARLFADYIITAVIVAMVDFEINAIDTIRSRRRARHDR